jgi:hypothetical protein
MTARIPNNALWQRVRKVFRESAGARWKAAAARTFNVQAKGLRLWFDRDLRNDALEYVDGVLIETIDAEIEAAECRLERLRNLRIEVATARNERSTFDIGMFDVENLADRAPATGVDPRIAMLADVLEAA